MLDLFVPLVSVGCSFLFLQFKEWQLRPLAYCMLSQSTLFVQQSNVLLAHTLHNRPYNDYCEELEREKKQKNLSLSSLMQSDL